MNKEHYCDLEKCKCPKCGSALYYSIKYKIHACQNPECHWVEFVHIKEMISNPKVTIMSTPFGPDYSWIRKLFIEKE
jgi:hypothetical protein